MTTTRLVDIVFPGDTNHHGTLFGGTALAHMDKVAFIAAARHAHVDFVTASCERIDFKAPARLGELAEVTARVTRAGRRSIGIEVELVAEALLSGERRLCGRGLFNMVAVGEKAESEGWRMPPLGTVEPEDDGLRLVDLVFPEQTSHYGSLYGGHALAVMGKAAFIAATRASRKTIVMAATSRVDFTAQIGTGEIMELAPIVTTRGRTSLTVAVTLASENLKTGARRSCGTGEFVMVAVDGHGRPTPLDGEG